MIGALWTYLRTKGDNFHVVTDKAIYRSAAPSAKDLAKWKEKHKIRTVLDLRRSVDMGIDSMRASDKARAYDEYITAINDLGLNRIWLPINDREPTDKADIDRALGYITNPTNWPILVHCAGGRHRTGLLVAYYRVKRLGWTVEDAMKEARKRGYYEFRHERFAEGVAVLLSSAARTLTAILCLLLALTPALGQGRFVITDGSPQSEYGAPASDRNVICPACHDKGERSTVRRWVEPTSYGFSYTPSINYYKSEARYWDEDGRYHDHELAQELLVCSSGHRFHDFDDRRCWCEWPHGRYVVVESATREGNVITLPPGTTWQDLLVTPAAPIGSVTLYDLTEPVSYQHPFIQPDLDAPAAAVVKESLTTRIDAASVEPKKFDRSFWVGASLFLTATALDWKTTADALDRGALEGNPLFAVNGGRSVRYGLNAFVSAVALGTAALAEKFGARRVARFILFFGAALRFGASIHNHRAQRP